MRHRTLSLVVAASLLLALPVAAEVYTIRLTNGTTFESRYQPKQAAWDPTQVTFVNETGNEISLPQSLIADVAAQSEVKGYGRVIDTTTVDLGFMPNDLDQTQQLMQQQAQQALGFGQLLGPAANEQTQFLEPGEPGQVGGIPLGFGSFGGFNGGFVPPAGFTAPPTGTTTTPAPFTTPTNTVTPPPFTIPSPGTASPPTSAPTSPQQ